MLKRTVIIASLATGLAVAAIPAQARHHDDRAAGAIIGGTLGALIGSQVNGGDGALVGGLLGAVAGAGVAGGHVYYGSPSYYAPSRYYATPRYYAAPRYSGYRTVRNRDADRDGVPNRFDRAPYNPRYR